VAVDSSGNVYVADTNNHRIQKFDSGGSFQAKWRSYGSGDGQFNCPGGVAVDSSGNVYVADTINHRIQKFAYDIQIVIEIVVDNLENMDVPEGAEKEVDKAIKGLNEAIDQIDDGKTQKAIGTVKKAVKNLMDAQDEGADTQDAIYALVSLVTGLVDSALEDAIEMAGADNDHVMKAQEHYNEALEILAAGDYDKAIKEFERAYKEAMKALSP